MKFLRFGPLGQEKPGCVDAGGRIRDLSAHISDLTPETLTKTPLLPWVPWTLQSCRSWIRTCALALVWGCPEFLRSRAELCPARKGNR